MKRAALRTAILLFSFLLPASAADNKSWVELGELTASDGQPYEQFGYSVAMSGNTIVVGAREFVNGNTSTGAAYVFVEPGAGNTQTAKLTASDGQSGDEFGASVAISGDTVVVGAPNADSYQGAVYVFVKPQGGWVDATETAKLTSSDAASGDELGFSVAIDGQTIVAGAPAKKYSHPCGVVYAFSEPVGGWRNMTETREFIPPSKYQRYEEFGWSVALGGTTMVAGAPYFPGGGVVGVFDVNTGAQMGTLFLRNAPSAGFGFVVQMTPDAVEIVVTASDQTVAGVPYAGAIYVFQRPKDGWRDSADYEAELTATDPSKPPYGAGLSASAVSLDGGEIVAEGLNVNFKNPLYVFEKGSGKWQSMTQTYEIFESAGNPLGNAVLSGSFICSGSSGVAVNGNVSQGAAFVFQLQ